MKAHDWTRAARNELLRLRESSGAWGYRSGSPPSTEPTALAGLSCLVDPEDEGNRAPAPESLAIATDAGRMLASIQNRDGSIGLSGQQRSPCWPTPYALLLWNAVTGFETPRRKAVDWLLRQKGRTISPTTDPDHVVGHDTLLVGWPWVSDTHSWLEPTAMAILALSKEGRGDHDRVREGIRLIGNRALIDGGWNYGNKAVFGTPLRAHPAPTGLALLALAQTESHSRVVEQGIEYLLRTLPTTRSASAIGWGVLGLRSWNRVPAEATHWLAESYQQATGRSDATPRLSLLLLASRDVSLGLVAGNRKGGDRG